MNGPIVSVCIPSYNYAHYIGTAIESALQQTYADLEVVVIDNCSTDDTEQVVARYMAADPRVRFLRNEENVGPRENLNRCLRHAAGDYIKVLCADDLLAPTCLEECVRMLEENSTASLVATGRRVINGAGELLRNEAWFLRRTTLDGSKAVRECLLAGNFIGEPSSVMFRRSDIRRGFDTLYRQSIDLEMWLHLLTLGDLVYLPQPLAGFRVHERQVTWANMRTLEVMEEEQWLFDRYGAVLTSPWDRCRWRLRVAYTIWTKCLSGAPLGAVHEMLHRFFPLPFFYLLLPFKATFNLTAKAIRRRIINVFIR